MSDIGDNVVLPGANPMLAFMPYRSEETVYGYEDPYIHRSGLNSAKLPTPEGIIVNTTLLTGPDALTLPNWDWCDCVHPFRRNLKPLPTVIPTIPSVGLLIDVWYVADLDKVRRESYWGRGDTYVSDALASKRTPADIVLPSFGIPGGGGLDQLAYFSTPVFVPPDPPPPYVPPPDPRPFDWSELPSEDVDINMINHVWALLLNEPGEIVPRGTVPFERYVPEFKPVHMTTEAKAICDRLYYKAGTYADRVLRLHIMLTAIRTTSTWDVVAPLERRSGAVDQKDLVEVYDRYVGDVIHKLLHEVPPRIIKAAIQDHPEYDKLMKLYQHGPSSIDKVSVVIAAYVFMQHHNYLTEVTNG